MEFETIKKDNRKKWVVGVIAVVAIASTIFFVSTRANYKATSRLNLINTTVNYSQSDLNVMAIKVQNSSGGYDQVNTVPTSGYTLSSDSYCEVNGNKDASISMEYKDGIVTIPVTSKGTKCYLFFDTQKTASQVLIAKNEMINENGYRYEGANPNNYVSFNNEVWRIIGVFDVINADTNKTESLVKIIRNESIRNMVWDTYGDNGSNDWTQSDVKTILNGQYYNGENINYTYRNPNNDRISSYPTVTIAGKSINNIARSMIENVKWNIGGASMREQNALKFYTEERGTKAYGNNPTTWNGYIGLMYASDYGYAADSTSCARTTNLYDYNLCNRNNWLYNDNEQWTLTSDSTVNYIYYVSGALEVYDYGRLYYGPINGFAEVRPSLYLKSNVSIVDNGNDGSSSKPYDLELI